MAHKKGAGSTRNGRDSNGQRRGVKRFGGQVVNAGEILVRQRRPPWLVGAALGLLAGCQLLTGEELLAMTGLLGFVLFVLLLLGYTIMLIRQSRRETAALRAVAYHSELAGFIDSKYPDRATREDVNSGSRTGGRLAFRFEPSENVVITPRLVYQKLETDGFPRADFFNMLGNVYTTTEPQVDPGERGQVTQLREGLVDA